MTPLNLYFDEKIIPRIIENKKAGEFTFQRYKEYRSMKGEDKQRLEKRDNREPKAKQSTWSFNYNRTHWKKEEKFPRKSFGRDHWGEIDGNKNRKKLPTPTRRT